MVDFAIHARELVACAVVATTLGSSALGSSNPMESPLRVLESSPENVVTPLALDAECYEALKSVDSTRLKDFPLGSTVRVDLELHRIDIFSPDAKIVINDGRGDRPIPAPDVVLLSGTVVGTDDSTVFLGLSPNACNGYVRFAGSTYIISSGRPGRGDAMGVFNLSELPEDAIEWSSFHCATGELKETPLWLPGDDSGMQTPPAPAQCQIVDVAIETDWQYYSWLFGDAEDAAAYAALLIGAISEIFDRDIGVMLRISYLRLWQTSGDPWNKGDTSGQLEQFRDYWEAEMDDVDRNIAHFLSGRSLGGGVAWLNGLCQGEYAYGLSADLNGYFPYPIQDLHGQNWDPYVVAHEIGHNFGGPHTHEHSPPIDGCGWGDCSVDGTIMSYCHGCPGGLSNILMNFHPMILDDIFYYMEYGLPCDISATGVGIYQHPADQTLCEGQTATFDVEAGGEQPLEYQWRKDGVDIPYADESQYVITDVDPGDNGLYDVVVTNICSSKTSVDAELAVQSSVGADLNCDGSVDVLDLLELLGSWGPCSDPPDCPADLDGNGVVDVLDLLELLGSWG